MRRAVKRSSKRLRTLRRYAHRYHLTGGEIAKAMALGEFMELTLPRPGLEYGDQETMEDLADRRTKSLHEDDELYEILEYHIDLNLPQGVDEYDDGGLELPYIVTCDKTTQEILSIRRNWRQDDENRKKRVWQRQQRKIIPAPPACRFRTAALQRVFDRLSLAESDVQSEQGRGEGIGPSVKAQVAQAIEQDRARNDDQRICENEIFGFQPTPHPERVDSDRGQ